MCLITVSSWHCVGELDTTTEQCRRLCARRKTRQARLEFQEAVTRISLAGLLDGDCSRRNKERRSISAPTGGRKRKSRESIYPARFGLWRDDSSFSSSFSSCLLFLLQFNINNVLACKALYIWPGRGIGAMRWENQREAVARRRGPSPSESVLRTNILRSTAVRCSLAGAKLPPKPAVYYRFTENYSFLARQKIEFIA